MTPLRPTFLVIGAMKAGTTSLYRYLRAHPDVFMPESKELNFFFEEAHGQWHRGRAWYEAQFAGAGDSIAIGEASAFYANYPVVSAVPERISDLLPAVRLVYVVRHPIDRIVSHYRQAVLFEGERDPIDVALGQGDYYLHPSRYGTQLGRFREHVDADRILVIRTDDLATDRERTVHRVLTFLGVQRPLPPGVLDERHHVAGDRRARGAVGRAVRRIPATRWLSATLPEPVMDGWRRLVSREVPPDHFTLSPELHRYLADRLAPDIEMFRHLLGDGDFNGWGIG